MKLFYALAILLVITTATFAQNEQRIPIASVIDPNFPNWDYSNFLDESLDSTVPNVWRQGEFYSTIIISLAGKSVITRLALYDLFSIFKETPAYIYAINDKDTTYIGNFTGEQYRIFINYPTPFPLVASKIAIRKYGNNIPQKVHIFGTPYITDSIADTLPVRLSVDAITSSINTGMDYTAWLNDSISSMVTSVSAQLNLQTVDVTLKLTAKSQVSKIRLYDFDGSWTDPTYIYLKKDTTLKLVGLFNGYAFEKWIDYSIPEGSNADAIVIRKFGNNIPQKVQVFGRVLPIDPMANIPQIMITPVPVTPPVIVTPPPIVNPSPSFTKIPIDGNRWFILNHAVNGVGSLFDNVISVKPNTGSANFSPTYECIYPLNDGEAITIGKIKMYDFQGIFSANPVQFFAIKKDGRKIPMATFTGTRYMTWVGPYPDRTANGEAAFNLDSVITDIQYIVMRCTRSDLPTEIKFYGSYTPPTPMLPSTRTYASFNKTLGMNGFSWDFVWPTSNTNTRIIAEDKYAAIKNFRGFRHYIDWKQLEGAEGKYYFNPCFAGGWSCDVTYERCKRDSIEVLACIQNIPDWMANTYPAALKASDNAPYRFGLSKDSVASYIEKGKLAFQFAARYGRNANVPLSLVTVSKIPRWTGDPVNVLKVGLNLVKYIECGNELNKWWRGTNGYMTAYQYAALLSAFYDGNKSKLGNNVGVKNADSTMQVVIGGLATDNPAYVRGMVEWCRINRGYRTDGKINLCWDVINYHVYSRDSEIMPTRGAAPEVSKAYISARDFVKFAETYCYGMPVWITETGFDVNKGSAQKAIAIGAKTVMQTQADWSLRSSLTFLREGISSLFFFELNDGNIRSSTKYASMGLTDTLFKRKPAMDYLYQTNQLMGSFSFNRSLQQMPVIDEYQNNGKFIYAIWVPDEKGTTMQCSINLPAADTVIVYRPVIGSERLQQETVAVVNGVVQLTATETPCFVMAKETPPNMLYVWLDKIRLHPKKNISTFPK